MPGPRLKRLLRISLRGLLLLMILLCLLLGMKVRQVERQQEAVRWVHNHGGTVFYDYQWEHRFPAGFEPDYSLVPAPELSKYFPPIVPSSSNYRNGDMSEASQTTPEKGPIIGNSGQPGE